MARYALEEFVAYQLSLELKRRVFELLYNSPAARDGKLAGQISDAVASISSNIAEGFRRYNPSEFATFVKYARGSLQEVRTRLPDGAARHYYSQQRVDDLGPLIDRLARVLTGLYFSLRRQAERKRAPPPRREDVRFSSSMPSVRVDVAIVGAGIAGTYCAWRLKDAWPSAKVALFEGSGRVGGRLFSVRPPGIRNMVAELGGMRILPAVQPRIRGLIDALNERLPARERIETYDFPVDQPQHLAYLRGTHLRLADYTAHPDRVPYNLADDERGRTPGDILIRAIARIVPGVADARLTNEDRLGMTQHAHFDGLPLYRQGFWNVILRALSIEGRHFTVDAGGYETTMGNWNAADAIPNYLGDYGIAPKYWAFRHGFQQVPLTLARLFQQAGGELHLATQLDGFDRAADGYTLRFSAGTVHARRLILAMPRRSLELLAPASPPLQPLHDDICSVTPIPLFKLFTTYDEPWWRAANPSPAPAGANPLEAGRTVTDLPLRQIYYWPTSAGLPAASGPAMLMASYDDGASTGFWGGMRADARALHGQAVAPADAFVGADDDDASAAWRRHRAPRHMVAEVTRQLEEIHGMRSAPVRAAAFRDWHDDPFGGGANFWNIGVKSWEVKLRMVQPADGLHICGEAYSDSQGWVEGALQTADMVLTTIGRL